MRQRLFLPLLSLLALGGCQIINPQDSPQAAPNGLIGRWELVSRSGGMVPTPTLPQETIEFAADSSVSVYRNGQLLQQYRFRPTTATGFCTNLPQPLRFLQFSTATQPGMTYAYHIQQNELVLDGNVCVDGTLSRYRWAPTAQ